MLITICTISTGIPEFRKHLINNLSSGKIVNTAFSVFDGKFSEILEQYRDIARGFRGIYRKKKKVLKETFIITRHRT